MRHPEVRRYVWLYVVALVFYGCFWAVINYVEVPDTYRYFDMGRGLFEHSVFGYSDESGVYHPNSFRMPLVPIILGLLYKLTGTPENTYTLYSLLQALLAPILPCTAFYLGRFISPRLAIFSFLLTLAEIGIVQEVVEVGTDIPFAAASSLAFIWFWKTLRRPNAQNGAFLGLWIGLACLVRPIMKLYVIVGGAATVLVGRPWRKALVAAGLTLGAFALCLLPWLIRNYRLYGEPVMETNQGLNLLWSHASLVQDDPSDSSETLAAKAWIRDHATRRMEIAYLHGIDYWLQNDLKVSKELSRIATDTYKRRPGEVLKTWSHNFWVMLIDSESFQEVEGMISNRPVYRKLHNLTPLDPSNFYRKAYHAWLEARRLFRLMHSYLVPLGLVLLAFRMPLLAGFIAGNVFYFIGLTAVVAGYHRYRLNLEPFMAILICYAIASVAGGIISVVRKTVARIRSRADESISADRS